MSKKTDFLDIDITPEALAHFCYLTEKEEIPGMALRIFVDHPGTPNADVSISFCPPGENRAGDLLLKFDQLPVYVERNSARFLNEGRIDYKTDNLGGQLIIHAPHLKGDQSLQQMGLIERVNHILQTEVNPGLAGHGGMVTLVEITPKNEVVLRFGGGCHGCGMVDVTLKQGIEKALIEQVPEITAVVDVTDHTTGENPYYA